MHKGGNTEDANNWRPIALLSITYKILARLVYYRIRNDLDKQQSDEQYGFRAKKSCYHALLVLESMVSKGYELSLRLKLWKERDFQQLLYRIQEQSRTQKSRPKKPPCLQSRGRRARYLVREGARARAVTTLT